MDVNADCKRKLHSYIKEIFESDSSGHDYFPLFFAKIYGEGYGRLLLQAVVSELKKMAFDKVFLWVLEENQNARHFYEKCGFAKTERCLISNIGGKEFSSGKSYTGVCIDT